MKNILLLEDDLILGETLKEILEDEDYKVTWVKDGNDGLSKTFEKDFDLYLFDVNVPFINGFELLQSLRENKDITPTIFITALVDIDNLTKGFKVGADDYIRKPFNANELIVRVDSLIKKSFKNYESTIKYNDLSYDIKEEKVYKENEEIHLSPSEHQLLVLFLKNIGKVINKDDILFNLHDNDTLGSDATLRVQISKLKK
ncbi:MAG: response regulator transcription factor [Candidatus Paceibacteria bacterium]